MRLRTDSRSQAIQIGAVLLFGILVILLATFQAFVVPDQNQEVEFKHNQEVQQQVQSTGSLITSVAGGGSGGSTTVQLGTTYPARSIFFNPQPAAGRLQTTELGEIEIEYSGANGNEPGVTEYWNGTTRTYATNSLAYEPRYSEYGEAPDTKYEHSLVLNDFGETSLSLSEQILVGDDELTIVTLEGEYSESRVDSVSLDVRALSSSANTVRLDGEIEVTLPTEETDLWEEQLAEFKTEVDPENNRITVTLTADQDLRMARVGVGDARRGTADERSEYAAVTDKRAPSVTVEIRDRYNNPVRGASVTISGEDDSGNQLSFEELSSYRGAVDEDGESEITLVSNRNGEIEIEGVEQGDMLHFGGADIDHPLEDFEVRQGAGAGTGEGAQPAYEVFWEDAEEIADLNANIDNEDGLVLNRSDGTTAELPMFTDPVADGADVSYSVNDTNIGTVRSGGQTDSDGKNSTAFDASDEGVVTIYSSSGSDGDQLQITVEGEESADDRSRFANIKISDNSEDSGSNKAIYTIDYTIDTDETTFENVTAEFVNTDRDESEEISSTDPSPEVPLEYESGGQRSGDEYEITVKLFDEKGEVFEERVEITDTSDGSGVIFERE